MASTTTRGRALVALLALATAGCASRHISALAPPPYRTDIPTTPGVTWLAIGNALAEQNVPLRAVARDSGVIASDDIVSPTALYAECGCIGDPPIVGEALVSYTLFSAPSGSSTRVQVNSKMRTQAHRTDSAGRLRPTPISQRAATERFELDLLDRVREFVKE